MHREIALMSLSFFVVGDIGEAGNPRRAVAQAMAHMLKTRQVEAAFVLATGDNFYECRSEEQFQNSFSVLEAEMLDAVPLPWYFALGNHDIKSEGARLHTENWHAREKGSGEAQALPSWRFRCPSSTYSVAEDWREVSGSSSVWDPSLLNIFVVNTNKSKGALNFLGLWPGSLKAGTLTWDEQKCWLRNQLDSSSAAWNFVVGHHPIEFIPMSYIEHGIPGVKFLTAGFMKGHQVSRIRRKGLRDVVVQGGTDVYLCGHQHLMAHLVRRGEERRPWRGGGPGSGTLEYWIIGSSSKLEQDIDDFVVADNDDSHGAEISEEEQSAPPATMDLGITDDQPDPQACTPAASYQTLACCCAPQAESSAESTDLPEQTVEGDVAESHSPEVGHRAEANAGRSATSWAEKTINRLSEKMSTMWYEEQIGFAVVKVTHTELSVCFYGVRGSVNCPEVQLLHQSTKRK